jgi:hypothetical protein
MEFILLNIVIPGLMAGIFAPIVIGMEIIDM